MGVLGVLPCLQAQVGNILAGAADPVCVLMPGGGVKERDPGDVALGLQVTVGLVKNNWGTELALEGRSMPLNGTLSLWVKDRAGGEDRACAWTATPSGRIRVTGRRLCS